MEKLQRVFSIRGNGKAPGQDRREGAIATKHICFWLIEEEEHRSFFLEGISEKQWKCEATSNDHRRPKLLKFVPNGP